MHLHDGRGGHGPVGPGRVGADRGRRAREVAQTFLVDVVVRFGGMERRAAAAGQDIYAVTAPLAVEAVRRILA